MFSAKDLERISLIKRWMDELGVNLAGVEIMLRMHEQIEQLAEQSARERQALVDQYETEIRRLKDMLLRVQAERR